MSRYLVTGATGFLGRHVVDALLAAGHEVVAFARGAGAGAGVGAGAAGAKPVAGAREGVVARRGDVLDAESVRDAAAGCAGVFHCAGKVSRKPEDAEELHKVHVEGTKTVLEACAAVGVARAVVASTSGTVAVSDDPEHVGVETDDAPIGLVNRWPYYRAKLFAERAALARTTPTFAVVSVNPSLLLGPGDVNGSSTEDVRLFLDRRIPAVPPGGLSFVDARDAAAALLLAMEKGEPGERYLVGACNLTVKDFFGRLERVSGVRAPVLPMPRAPELAKIGARAFERLGARFGLTLPVDPVSLDMSQFFWYVDSTRAETVLGWQPRDPTETLADTVEDLRARGVVWPEAR